MRTIALAVLLPLALAAAPGAFAQPNPSDNAITAQRPPVYSPAQPPGAGPAASEGPSTRGDVAISGAERERLTVLAPDPRLCASGFVWRTAGPHDYVCAPPASRDRVAQENAQHEQNRNPDTYIDFPSLGASPIHMLIPGVGCRPNFVERNALANDAICVTFSARDLAQQENALGPSRLARP